MAKEVYKVIPVAERIIEFNSEDVRKNFKITHFSEDLILKKDWEKFAENALVIMDGWNILQYAEEYPIVHYRCDEDACIYIEGGFRLNSFIESITVSTARYGKKAGFGSGKLDCETTDYDTVIYYTDHVGINHAIIQHDICCFLLQKPKLIVSPEGVLVFFTDKQIIATVDCNSFYYWIDERSGINLEDRTIKNIEVCNDYCKVILVDNEENEYLYSLKFDFDIAGHQMIHLKATNL